jgi:hypothetical protein
MMAFTFVVGIPIVKIFCSSNHLRMRIRTFQETPPHVKGVLRKGKDALSRGGNSSRPLPLTLEKASENGLLGLRVSSKLPPVTMTMRLLNTTLVAQNLIHKIHNLMGLISSPRRHQVQAIQHLRRCHHTLLPFQMKMILPRTSIP